MKKFHSFTIVLLWRGRLTSWHINLMNALLQIVSEKSATIGVVHEDVVGVVGDHKQICRIKDETEAPFRRIVLECRKLGSGYPEKQRRK